MHYWLAGLLFLCWLENSSLTQICVLRKGYFLKLEDLEVNMLNGFQGGDLKRSGKRVVGELR